MLTIFHGRKREHCVSCTHHLISNLSENCLFTGVEMFILRLNRSAYILGKAATIRIFTSTLADDAIALQYSAIRH